MSNDLIPNSEKNVEIDDSIDLNKVRVICPVCKCDKEITMPKSIVNRAEQLTTISIPKGLICKHHFQAFVDKQFNVRGYQKVDFELTSKKIGDGNCEEGDDALFKSLTLEGNYLEYNPKKKANYIEYNKNIEDALEKKIKVPPLEEMYEEFWEFIDDDNHIFREFILKDRKRRETLKNIL
ncbi:MAG: hypothetical protein ACFFAN_05850 [Promethearchaeota archaeon]